MLQAAFHSPAVQYLEMPLSATLVKMAKNSCPLLRGCSTACREDHPLLEPCAPADHYSQVLPCSKFSITLVLCWLWGPEYKGDRFLALRSVPREWVTLPMNNMDAISENCYCINLFKVVDSTKIQLNNDLSNFGVKTGDFNYFPKRADTMTKC